MSREVHGGRPKLATSIHMDCLSQVHVGITQIWHLLHVGTFVRMNQIAARAIYYRLENYALQLSWPGEPDGGGDSTHGHDARVINLLRPAHESTKTATS